MKKIKFLLCGLGIACIVTGCGRTVELTEEENERNALWFLENFPFAKERERTLFPGIDKTDGFYMISFLRKS